jgi:succinyl-CoA synthetase alpha subunit
MGHAGAIVGGADDTAAAKMKIMRECGINVVESPAVIGEMMASCFEGVKVKDLGKRIKDKGYCLKISYSLIN